MPRLPEKKKKEEKRLKKAEASNKQSEDPEAGDPTGAKIRKQKLNNFIQLIIKNSYGIPQDKKNSIRWEELFTEILNAAFYVLILLNLKPSKQSTLGEQNLLTNCNQRTPKVSHL